MFDQLCQGQILPDGICPRNPVMLPSLYCFGLFCLLVVLVRDGKLSNKLQHFLHPYIQKMWISPLV